MAELRDSVLAYVEGTLAPRAKGRGISLSRRVGSVLREHAKGLPSQLSVLIRSMCAERLPAFQDRLEDAIASTRVDERAAALLLGLSLSDLRLACRAPEVRRQLGWPRPLAGRMYFVRDVFDPSLYSQVMATLPRVEPWPTDMWLEGWR